MCLASGSRNFHFTAFGNLKTEGTISVSINRKRLVAFFAWYFNNGGSPSVNIKKRQDPSNLQFSQAINFTANSSLQTVDAI
jgi:hypothetical protein